MIAHLQSPVTRCRLMTFDEAECPDGADWDALHERLRAKVKCSLYEITMHDIIFGTNFNIEYLFVLCGSKFLNTTQFHNGMFILKYYTVSQ